MSGLTLVSEWKHFDGKMRKYSHKSKVLGDLKATFFIYLPSQADSQTVPVLYYLAGLTCTGENGSQKGNFAQVASERGVSIVFPDTSPRGSKIEGEDESYDFGSGAGFYVNATAEKWAKNYQMYSYVNEELPSLIEHNFNVKSGKAGIFGHSMGGHGALVIALKNPQKFCSVSAFAPICNPSKVQWGKKAFSGYIGNNEDEWLAFDATEIMEKNGPFASFEMILIDQGTNDEFLEEQLKPKNFALACSKAKQKLKLRMQEGYDHSYYFISSFASDHVNFHCDALEKEYGRKLG